MYSRHKSLYYFIMIAFIIISCVLLYIEHRDTEQDNTSINNYTTGIRRTNADNKKYTNHYVITHFDRDEPNINSANYSSEKRIKSAFYLAYNHCQTSNKFNANKAKISQILGKNFGSSVNYDVQPRKSNNYNGTLSKSMRITSLKIGFGKFNTVSKALPINVLVSYRTPRYNASSSMNHNSRIYYTAYQISYQPKNNLDNQFTVDHCDSGLNAWNVVFK